MGRGLDDIAGIFLRDLGLTHGEEASYREAELMDDYLPERRQDNTLTRLGADTLPPISPQVKRLTGAEKRIIQQVREAGLVQEATLSLVERSIEMSGEARARTALNLLSQTQSLLTLRNLARTESPELGEIMDKTVKRMLHDHFNDALRKHNMQEELDARLIEDVNRRLQSSEVRRSFWNGVLGR